MTNTKELKEQIIDDDWPVHVGYFYVVDGRVVWSPVSGTVRDLRRAEIQDGKTANEVRLCDCVGRGFFDKMDPEPKKIEDVFDFSARSKRERPRSSKTNESRKRNKKKNKKRKR